MSKYTIGIDYGTLSGRAVLVDIQGGRVIDSKTYDYPHGVMDTQLPTGEKLGSDWALQDPMDYIEVLKNTVPKLLSDNNINQEDVIGIGIDFTACTVLPVLKDGTPLCFIDKYKHNPHSYVKLWKHHAAQNQANRLNNIAKERNEKWLYNYGGKISSEWSIPKLWQVLEEAPEIYEAMDLWIEAADWIVWVLTGIESRNSCTAGYKAMYNKRTGFPSKEFFKALDPRLENVIDEKIGNKIIPLGTKAGEITNKAAELTGLKPGTAVAVGNVDAHVCIAAVGIDSPGKLLAIVGTSTCDILMGTEEKQIEGICGVVEDGVLPGYYGYEAGQSCVGDHFQWFVENCVPRSYYKEAEKNNESIHQYLSRLAEKQKPGESGLIALDWWNGNRSVLVDTNLSGVILGMTLQTKAEEIYRSLIEATAYGTRKIIENFIKNGIPIDEFYASGGISQKNPFMMQIYADVLNLPIKIAGSEQGPAHGSAIFAAVAAGKELSGYKDAFEAIRVMGKVEEKVYRPNTENVKIYDELYKEYDILHDYFGRGANDVMKRIKAIKINQKNL